MASIESTSATSDSRTAETNVTPADAAAHSRSQSSSSSSQLPSKRKQLSRSPRYGADFDVAMADEESKEVDPIEPKPHVAAAETGAEEGDANQPNAKRSKIDESTTAAEAAGALTDAASSASSSSTHASTVRAPRSLLDLPFEWLEPSTHFLTFGEMLMFMRSNRHLRSSMPRLNVRSSVLYLAPPKLPLLCDSPHRRMVSSLGFQEMAELSSEQLLLLTQSLPHLKQLKCRIEMSGQPSGVPLSFPASLTDLTLVLEVWNVPLALTQSATEVIAALPLAKLHLVILGADGEGGSGEGRKIYLEPLRDLRSTLSDLSIEFCGARVMHEDVEVIRALDSLKQLTISDGELADEQLEWLTAPFEDGVMSLPNLTSLDLGSIMVRQPMVTALSRLTGLTELEPFRFDVPDVSFVGSFRRLKSLELRCTEKVVVSTMIAGVAQIGPNLTSLVLTHPTITDDKVTELLSHLTKLQSLSLEWMPQLSSLRFASHLAHCLMWLDILSCPSIPVSEVDHLDSLRHLRHLDLCGSFSEVFPPALASLDPRSKSKKRREFLQPFTNGSGDEGAPDAAEDDEERWPFLETFMYEPPASAVRLAAATAAAAASADAKADTNAGGHPDGDGVQQDEDFSAFQPIDEGVTDTAEVQSEDDDENEAHETMAEEDGEW